MYAAKPKYYRLACPVPDLKPQMSPDTSINISIIHMKS